MRLWIKISIALIIILMLLFSVAYIAYIFVNTKGKAILAQKLEDAFKKEVNIGQLEVKIPLVLEIRDLKIDKLANISYICVHPSFFDLLRGKVILNEVMILKPEINWERSSLLDSEIKNQLTNTQKPSEGIKDNSDFSTEEIRRSLSLPIIIRYLSIKDGMICFIDRTVIDPGIQIVLRNFSAEVDNLCLFSEPAITSFQITAKVPWQKDSYEAVVYVSGWINPYKKDMQARFEIEDIDGVYLYPYYSNWIDLENSRIKEASLNFSSDIQGQNNEVLARCRLELTDIKFNPRPINQPEHKAEKITAAVLGIFRALNQGRVILIFSVKTKMDKPEFNFAYISQAVDKTLSEAIKSDKVKVEDLAELPSRFFEGVRDGATGASRAVIDGAVSVGKSLKDAFLDALKSEGGIRANNSSARKAF